MKADLVVVGGGVVGLGIAYYAAKSGLQPLVLEKDYLNSGSTGRSFGLIKERWPEKDVTKLATAGLKAHEKLSSNLGMNTLFRQDGCLTLALTEEELRNVKESHKAHKAQGIPCKFVEPEDIGSVTPLLKSTKVLGGCYNKREGIVYSPALIWALKEGVETMGGTITKFANVSRIKVEQDSVKGVEINTGEYFEARKIVLAAGINSRELLADLELELPLEPIMKEMLVTEPMRPLLHPVLERPNNGFRLGQTLRGEMIGTSGFIPHQSVLSRHSLGFLSEFSKQVVELIPSFSRLKVLRQWTGVLDTTPDNKPAIGETKIKELYVACGFNEFGVTVAPVVAKMVFDLICCGERNKLLEPFSLERFD